MEEHVLSLSYGKDSLACLGAIEQLGWPLDRIIHAEVWATDTIPADPPPMVEFKAKADAIIKERWGIEVEHLCATNKAGEKVTYEKLFYHVPKRRPQNKVREQGSVVGFPIRAGHSWCTRDLKTSIINNDLRGGTNKHRIPVHNRSMVQETQRRDLSSASRSFEGIGVPATSNGGFSSGPLAQGAKKNIVQYLGIAADEPERIARHQKPGFKLPLVEIGWEESYCRKWCEQNGLLSPIYTTATRGGCWFCHNQGIDQLRLLRQTYLDLWSLLLKWDRDSPTTFKADGHTVHDFDLRFHAEDLGLVPTDRTFRWKMLDESVVNACKRDSIRARIMKMLEQPP